jgi:hypothetical protein
LEGEGEDEEIEDDDDIEPTEWETDDDDSDEDKEDDPRKLYVRKPKLFILTQCYPELEIVVKDGVMKGKSVIILLQEHDDTVKCLEWLNDYIKAAKNVRKEDEKAARLAAKIAKKHFPPAYVGDFSEEEDGSAWESEEGEIGEDDGEVDEYEYEKDVEDEEEYEEDDEEVEKEVREVLQPGTKRGREEFEDDFHPDFSKSFTIRKFFCRHSIALSLY